MEQLADKTSRLSTTNDGWEPKDRIRATRGHPGEADVALLAAAIATATSGTAAEWSAPYQWSSTYRSHPNAGG